MLNIFQKRELNIEFIGKRKLGFFLSVVLLAISIFSLCTKGLNYGIDFEGGLLIEATSEQVVDLKKVRNSLSFLRDLSIQTAGTEGKTILIQAKPEENQNASQLVSKIKDTLGPGYQFGQVEMIGPTIGKELKEKSLLASVLALLLSQSTFGLGLNGRSLSIVSWLWRTI